MNRTLERAVWLIAALLTALALCGCDKPVTKRNRLEPRHDAPFDVLPPEHIKALEESRRNGL